MKKKTGVLIAAITASLAGCATMTAEEAAYTDRAEMLSHLQHECAAIGSDITPVSPTVDETSQAFVAITERQCSVVSKYSDIVNNHKDVASFFDKHAGESPEEVASAIEAEEMKEQIDAYKTAQQGIYGENTELFLKLGVQATKMALIYTNNAQDIITAESISFASNILSSTLKDEGDQSSSPIVSAYKEMKDRYNLINNANKLISAEKDTLEQYQSFDEQIDAKVEDYES